MNPPWPLVVLLCVLVPSGVVLGVFLGKPGTAPDSGSSVDLAAIRSLLEEATESLRRIEQQNATATQGMATVTPTGQPAPTRTAVDIAPLVEALRAALQEEGVGAAEEGAPGKPLSRRTSQDLDAIRRARPGPDWSAWDEVADAWEENDREARVMLQLLTPAQVLQRFGAPTRITETQAGNVQWSYDDPPERTRGVQRFTGRLTFAHGYVTDVYVRRLAPYVDR